MDLLNPREPINTWSHGLWLMIGLVGIVMLWRRSQGDRARQISLMIYGLSLIFCSACSTLYHGVHLPREQLKPFDTMDHIGIFMLIAGTYTPIAWTFLQGHWRRSVLGLVWFWAAFGIALRITRETQPAWIATGFYLGMGWGALFCYFEVARRLSHRIMVPIVAGGVLYSVGAIVNLLHAPVLWPGVFQSHELFHVLVVAASLCHFYFMFTVVGPSELDAQFDASPIASSAASPAFSGQPLASQAGG